MTANTERVRRYNGEKNTGKYRKSSTKLFHHSPQLTDILYRTNYVNYFPTKRPILSMMWLNRPIHYIWLNFHRKNPHFGTPFFRNFDQKTEFFYKILTKKWTFLKI